MSIGIDCSRITSRVVVDAVTGCWLWQGKPDAYGYGRLSIENRVMFAHRVSYALFVGEIPEKHDVHHRCETPMCVNPEHLVAMTRAQHAAQHDLCGVAAAHAAATTCANGHPFTHHDGYQRVCRICARKRAREWARRKRQERRNGNRSGL